MKEKDHIAIYLRLSMEDKIQGDALSGIACALDESNSITSQRKMLLEYIRKDAELAGQEVVEFCDDGISGTSMNRPGVQKLLKEVKQGIVKCILVKDMSRFSRDYIELGTYLNQIFPFMGVRFIAVNDHYDSKEQAGDVIGIDTAFQTLLYDLYSKDLSVKVKASHQSKKANGEYITGEIPFGYERSREKKNTVVINQKEAEIVRYIFSLAVDGLGSAQIARRLVAEQIPTPMQMHHPGRKGVNEHYNWSDKAVRRILNNRFYLGEMAYGKTVRKSVGSKSVKAVPKEQWKVIPNHHEPLITQEIYALVNKKCPEHSSKRIRKRYSLTGKIYCGGCGYAMSYRGSTKYCKCHCVYCARYTQLRTWDCCTYFNAVMLEEIVLKELYEELKRRGNLVSQRENLQRSLKGSMDSLSGTLQKCERQNHVLVSQKDALYTKYVARQIGAEEYRRQADMIDDQIRELSQKQEEARAQYEWALEASRRDKEDMKQIIRFSHLEELTQEAVDIFIKRVTLYRDKRVEIEWSFSEEDREYTAEAT
ncbi:MAG: recombinase family protein [Acetatifactor sp.]|nr:recombinase family protein [Acetatifactor sp.]